MYFNNDLHTKKLKPQNAIEIFHQKIMENVLPRKLRTNFFEWPLFRIEHIFKFSSFAKHFYQFEIFLDELGIAIHEIDIRPYRWKNSEEKWIESFNLYLFLISDILLNQPAQDEETTKKIVAQGVTIEIPVVPYAEEFIKNAEWLAPHLGYRLQTHTENNIFTLVPTEVKEWMQFEDHEQTNATKEVIADYYISVGNLAKKRSILLLQWPEYEKYFKGSGSDVGRIMNKYNIRHNDDSGIPAEIKDSPKEIELHYDHCFSQMMIAFRFIAKTKLK